MNMKKDTMSKGVRIVRLKKSCKKPLYKDCVIITSGGVKTSDKKGDKFYRGQPQSNISMTGLYFTQAQNFWAKQVLNGQPMNLLEVQVIAASNSVIPYNMPNTSAVVPQLAARKDLNSIGWYNVKFENGETGWICGSLYPTGADAARAVAADTVYKLYNDRKVIACVRSIMEKQK